MLTSIRLLIDALLRLFAIAIAPDLSPKISTHLLPSHEDRTVLSNITSICCITEDSIFRLASKRRLRPLDTPVLPRSRGFQPYHAMERRVLVTEGPAVSRKESAANARFPRDCEAFSRDSATNARFPGGTYMIQHLED